MMERDDEDAAVVSATSGGGDHVAAHGGDKGVDGGFCSTNCALKLGEMQLVRQKGREEICAVTNMPFMRLTTFSERD